MSSSNVQHNSDSAPPGNAPPLAFLCHGSNDNERFVFAFDAALRRRGIRTWFDQREVCLGDYLIDRIFDKSLDPSDYVV